MERACIGLFTGHGDTENGLKKLKETLKDLDDCYLGLVDQMTLSWRQNKGLYEKNPFLPQAYAC